MVDLLYEPMFPVLRFQLTIEVFDYMDSELRLAESGKRDPIIS